MHAADRVLAHDDLDAEVAFELAQRASCSPSRRTVFLGVVQFDCLVTMKGSPGGAAAGGAGSRSQL